MQTTGSAHLRAVALAVALAAAACGGQGKGAQGAAATGDVAGDILRGVEQWRQAYEVRSLEAMSPLYTHADDVVRIHQGRAVKGWREVENQLHGDLTHAQEIHVRLKDIQVVPLGPKAVAVTSAITRDVSDGVTTVTETGFLSLVLRVEGERWVIVSEHYSFAPQS